MNGRSLISKIWLSSLRSTLISFGIAVDKNGAKPKEGKGGKDADTAAAVRDTALTVLGRQTSDGLLSVDGKERLKAELKAAMAEHNAELKVTDLFFTEFLVQR